MDMVNLVAACTAMVKIRKFLMGVIPMFGGSCVRVCMSTYDIKIHCLYVGCALVGLHNKLNKMHGRLRLICDGTRAETRFRLSAKRTSPFK